MNRRILVLLAFIALAGFSLRALGIHFGLPSRTHTLATYHPDESIHLYSFEKINPGTLDFYPGDALYWGSFHFYLQGAATRLLGAAGYLRMGDRQYFVTHLEDADKLYIIGRMISIVFGTGSIIVFFLIGRKLYGTGGGILAAALMAVTPLAVTTSFYAKPDGVMFFWYLLSILYALVAVRTGKTKDYVLYGVFLGAAIASKYSGLISVLFFLLVQGEQLYRTKGKIRGAAVKSAAALGIALATFIVINPYAVLRFHDFWRYFSGMMISKTFMPPRLLDGYFDYLAGILPAATGWPVYAAALSGMLLLFAGRRIPAEPAMAVFAVLYVLRLGPPRGQALTYCLPLVPFLLLFSVKGILAIAGSRWGKTVVAAMFIYTIAYAVSYKGSFMGRDTREIASDWIAKNIPLTATIAMSKNDFWTPPVLKEYRSPYTILCGMPPQSSLSSAIFAFEDRARQADYVVVTNHEYGEYFRYHADYPRENDIIKAVMQKDFEEIARFERRRPGFFGLPYFRYFVTLDWMFPNPTIHILKRKQA